jgi:hypothetical protein
VQQVKTGEKAKDNSLNKTDEELEKKRKIKQTLKNIQSLVRVLRSSFVLIENAKTIKT